MPRADRCKRKKEEELRKAASKQPLASVAEIQRTEHRDCNENLSDESLTELEKEDFNNAPLASNITSFKFSEPLRIGTHIVTVEACSSNASVCNKEYAHSLTVEDCSSNASAEDCADLPISFHSEETPTEDAIIEGPTLSVCTAHCCLNDAPFIPTEYDLKKTSQKQTTSSGKDVKIRKCTASLFAKYPWATYCLTKGTIACFYCRKASNMGLLTFSYHKTEKTFCDGDFCNWKKCLEKLHKHGCSHCHSESVEKVQSLKVPHLDVGAILNKKYKLEQEMHRDMLLRQLSSLQYLTRQGLAIRGDHEVESNLFQLLKTRSEDVPNLKRWIENSQYTSPVIVNELIEMMGNDVLRSILEDIRSNSVQWVSVPELSTHEDFVGMYHLEETDAETITDCLKDILLRCNLPLDNCRWQAYDGAATMSGHLSGVAARIATENPAAHRIHCANHRLDLALKGCAKESEIIRETLTFVQDLAVFISNSPKRMSIYEDIAKDQTIAKAAELDFVVEPKLSRRRQVPRHLQILEAPQHHYESAEAFYRASYYEAIDACIAELNRRFDEASYAPLQNLEDVFLNAGNDQPFQFSKQVCESYGKQVDFEEAGA
eukprot:Seg1840.3 transcript_id=Seg1840.3/GoldUCD/mRNA.D3Y31 product="Zinc finger MYM-type protein 1" protein_id=Seg1840.3/GoldUCD/D3Y31